MPQLFMPVMVETDVRPDPDRHVRNSLRIRMDGTTDTTKILGCSNGKLSHKIYIVVKVIN